MFFCYNGYPLNIIKCFKERILFGSNLCLVYLKLLWLGGKSQTMADRVSVVSHKIFLLPGFITCSFGDKFGIFFIFQRWFVLFSYKYMNNSFKVLHRAQSAHPEPVNIKLHQLILIVPKISLLVTPLFSFHSLCSFL